MNRDLLVRLAEEAAGIWVGQAIHQVLMRPAQGIALLSDSPRQPALDIAPLPPSSWVAATTVRLRADEQGLPGRAALSQRLTGNVVTSMSVLAGERILRLSLASGEQLLVEMLGAAGNLYLLNGDGIVTVCLRPVSRPGGAMECGQRWRPPEPAAAGAMAPSQDWLQLQPPPRPSQAGLESPLPTRDLEPLNAQAFRHVQLRSHGPENPAHVFEPADTLGDAVLRLSWLRQRHLQALQRAERWKRRLLRERKRLARLLERLQGEAQEAAGHQLLRRQAECLVAGLAQARRDGLQVWVPDIYDSAGKPIAVAVRPGELPPQAADRLFRRAGRLAHAAGQVDSKLRQVSTHLTGLTEMLQAAEGFSTLQSVIEAEAQAPPWLRETGPGRVRQAAHRPPGRKARRGDKDPRGRKVKRYPLSQDWQALVGGDAAVNDYLSFRMARPKDFWLHVADYPGAHVVIRNPRRCEQPPSEVLRQAAELAAWFSRARGRGPVDVRWVQARYLRKSKGLPAGMVLLSRFATVVAESSAPPRRGVDESA